MQEMAARRSRARAFSFTLNNYTEDDIKLIATTFNNNECSYVFQEEKGREGTRHLQGCFRTKNPMDFSTIKSWMPRAHLEKAKNWRSLVKYCCKQETRIGRVFHSDDVKVPEIAEDPLTREEVKLLAWQEECIEIAKGERDDREIHWWVDRAGGRGKTSMCKHLVLKHDACYVAGKGENVKYLIANWIAKRGVHPKLIVINLTRTLENFVNYGVIEEIKDGLFVSSKYKTEAIIMNSPTILIFANFSPDMRKMTKDRWVIHDLDEQYESGGEEERERRVAVAEARIGSSAAAPAGAGAGAGADGEEDERGMSPDYIDEPDEKHID